MLRISTHEISPDRIVIKLEGRLGADRIPEVRTALSAFARRPNVDLDLFGVASVDPAGCAFLRELVHAGHGLIGCSLYVSRLIEETNP